MKQFPSIPFRFSSNYGEGLGYLLLDLNTFKYRPIMEEEAHALIKKNGGGSGGRGLFLWHKWTRWYVFYRFKDEFYFLINHRVFDLKRDKIEATWQRLNGERLGGWWAKFELYQNGEKVYSKTYLTNPCSNQGDVLYYFARDDLHKDSLLMREIERVKKLEMVTQSSTLARSVQ